jgi:feruloyl-CoA synthase
MHGILQSLRPALVYASDAAVYGASPSPAAASSPVVFGRGPTPTRARCRSPTLVASEEGPAVMQAFRPSRPTSHAKYLLTSGSTGQPKVVVNTHRMLCANQQMMAQAWRFLAHEKPVLVDWLPWSHTFGANHNLHMVLRNGGTLVHRRGPPAPGLIEKTLANLAEVQPTIWFNVPRGFDMALPLLEADDALARRGVRAVAAWCSTPARRCAPSTWERLRGGGRKRVRRREVWLTTSWGATETSPAITSRALAARWRRLSSAACCRGWS